MTSKDEPDRYPLKNQEAKLERGAEVFLSAGRWFLLPFFLLLIAILLPLACHFLKESVAVVTLVIAEPLQIDSKAIMEPKSKDLAVGVEVKVLTLIDTALIASLVIIVALCGYHNFVSKINYGLREANIKKWLKKVEFADLKLKLMSAIVAISGIELLKGFLEISAISANEGGQQLSTVSDRALFWKVGIHLTFAVSVLLFAIADRITVKKDGREPEIATGNRLQLSK